MHPPLAWTLAAALVTAATLATATQTVAESPFQVAWTTIPGTGYELPIDTSFELHQAPDAALLDAVTTWLGKEFDLKPALEHPGIVFASEEELAAIWLSGVETDDLAGNDSHDSAPEIVALYDLREQTIFLPDNWSVTSPVDLSVLVHEMVHHLQAAAEIRFACPQQREDLAYAAQDKWLALFGTNLEEAFEVDAFSLLVRTQCLR